MTRPDRSLAEIAALLPDAARARLLDAVAPAALGELIHHWPFWERPGQRPPLPPWRVWLVLAGRGYGKTRIGAEWVRALAEAKPGLRIALVAATQRDARRVMVEGESGLLAIAPDARRPHWEPSLGRLCWTNGAQAHVYSAAEPESLRGGQHHFAWADEIAKWEHESAWDNLMLSLRLGRAPQVVATTTPRPVPLVKRLVAAPGVAITRGRTRDNRAHLSAAFLAQVEADYGGTRLGRQELDGELIDEVEGALWRRALIEGGRAPAPPLTRVVVGVDPPAGTAGDACGIVAAGLGADGHGYVLEDASVAGLAPDGWARAVAACAQRHRADRVVAEANNGGAMVRSILHAADARLPVTLVHASHGKAARAEPIAILYEAGRVHHVGAWPALEDELCGLVAGGGYAGPGRSPDRANALVWALTELLLGARARAALRWL